jgi:hypothetical protein
MRPAGPTPYNYLEADWRPLERAVGLAGLPLGTCGAFMWMCEEPMGVHQYKHRVSRRYLRLTIDTDLTVVELAFLAEAAQPIELSPGCVPELPVGTVPVGRPKSLHTGTEGVARG